MNGTPSRADLPFLYGAQYYRAPTPDRRFWADDLARMADAGFNHVKFWAQWRWAHRRPDEYVFDDLAELMDLAGEAGLAVTINLIFDVAPDWLFRHHPDARMVTCDGRVCEPRTLSCRQIGGYPGPCTHHAPARDARRGFLEATVRRFASHPAMGMWDVWNEPELHVAHRTPRTETLLCYCPNCRAAFQRWLADRYGQLDALNRRWGRCYGAWEHVEVPRSRECFHDMIDWRRFFLDTLAGEARWRLKAVRAIDAAHPAYLHPVPNTMNPMNAVTCVDDFQLADECDVWGGTINGKPIFPVQAVSSAQGRVCYNVESHVRFGSTAMYPRPLSAKALATELTAQIGLGVRGMLYWQYRAEVLGKESPAWGLLDVDGRPGATHEAAAHCGRQLARIADKLMAIPPRPAQAAIVKSTDNELLHWCIYGRLDALRSTVDGYTHLLYRMNAPLGYVDDRMVVDGLDDEVRLLVLPAMYGLTEEVAASLLQWVRKGGHLLCEAHTGAVNLTTGRHETTVPGAGLADALGLREVHATAVAHLPRRGGEGAAVEAEGDVAKAAEAFGLKGGQWLAVPSVFQQPLAGAYRYAELEGGQLEPLAGLDGRLPLAGRTRVGEGEVTYIGTWAGCLADAESPGGLGELLTCALDRAGVSRDGGAGGDGPMGVRLDPLDHPAGRAWAVVNLTDASHTVRLPGAESRVALFSGKTVSAEAGLTLPPGEGELVVTREWLV